MSEDKILWHYSRNATQAGKNYASFRSLLRSAIAMAPSTVKFTSPDIEDLQAKLELATSALKYYAMDLLVDLCLSDIIFDSIEHECTTCRTKTTGVTSCNDDKIGAVARLALQKIKDSEVE